VRYAINNAILYLKYNTYSTLKKNILLLALLTIRITYPPRSRTVKGGGDVMVNFSKTELLT